MSNGLCAFLDCYASMEKVTDSMPKSSHVANRANGPPYAQSVMSMDSDDGISYKAIGGTTGQLLEQNAQALDQISANFTVFKSGKDFEHIELHSVIRLLIFASKIPWHEENGDGPARDDKLHGHPEVIVTYCDPKLMDSLLEKIHRFQRKPLSMSTAYHLQMDGQSEALNVGMPDHQITPLKFRNEQAVLSNLDEKIQENINLFTQARNNIFTILNDLNDMPEIMKQMPPLPVKLNDELASLILPPRPPLPNKS
ncbi:hypothetical protein MTR67_039736 [Solanum verrucosum]|uniref:Uncharacterized protein n=1 Tax=Solanum verrucosum TaxID=315347 RepID=A0AAF0ZP65_SOLVR|nr:hypothetical protein MTR67_039736 [Solanum verrucosum]